MLIIALVLALIGLVALVFAVVTSNELVAWVCIGASVLGVVLLIIDGLRERQQVIAGDGDEDDAADSAVDEEVYVDYPEEASDEGEAATGDSGSDESSEEASEASEESAVSADRSGDDSVT
ncbi:hypothetical protein [Mycobacterium decipiens]|uniref:Transmembrane protein n=1 Tax=Mycobacterium decipiens TaxID=1430326 RepID=A0A1X2LX36_9MYCO|nr:hypothetical protein [Mycobacterium decipiens]OSC41765.1 hypothetical protein B8W66_06455 [Mycobacterium decipiens]